ncbi:inositol monophosphatase family protein [Micromonospora zingiberis]|uniref:Inositol monophosphatase family protein n=1 Tax=Micromonospora zingiberis TaxID=2053011 RepID=A0A4R0GXF9_9ACTN|nr:inositol monophosphatase family protein [Micromonospora zingiberis]TCC00199.1 inositol monophosphatase family protein [Micromonospora zingiberis]
MALSDAELAVTAAQRGAAVVLARYGTTLARTAKAAGDFATVADIEAEQAILRVLREVRPGDQVLAEESGRTGAGDNGRTWLVDPLCGTLNYAARTMLASVNVALRVDGTPTVAACADPFAAEVFWTDGNQARVRRDGRDEPMEPSAASGLVEVNLDPPHPNAPVFRAVRLLAEPDFVARFRPRVVSTTLAVAWVAAGRRAGYVTDGPVGDSVHFAAGLALCRAAGCVVTGLAGQPPRTGVGGLLVAADEETHEALSGLVARQFAAGHTRF